MTGKIPGEEAFALYVSLGPARSYQAVADRFGVNKRSLTRHASQHGWQARLESIERDARKRSDEQLTDAITEANERHLKMFKAIQGRALEALRSMPLNSAFAAVRSLDLSIKGERLILGEPTDRQATSVEDIIKREYQSWLGTATDDEWDALAAEGAGAAPDDDEGGDEV